MILKLEREILYLNSVLLERKKIDILKCDTGLILKLRNLKLKI